MYSHMCRDLDMKQIFKNILKLTCTSYTADSPLLKLSWGNSMFNDKIHGKWIWTSINIATYLPVHVGCYGPYKPWCFTEVNQRTKFKLKKEIKKVGLVLLVNSDRHVNIFNQGQSTKDHKHYTGKYPPPFYFRLFYLHSHWANLKLGKFLFSLFSNKSTKVSEQI